MDSERWKRVDDLLQATLPMPADQQEKFLRQECAGDTDLLQEVQSLLTAHGKADGFLDQPAIHVVAQAVASEPASPVSPSFTGQTVSHYRVLAPLGSGGMGVVYRAEDVMLRRGVAMKFLPGELASDRIAFERLQREARSASALDHPNICSIYELGEHDGQPFIVMQLLEGQTQREWIEHAAEQDVKLRIRQAVDFAIQIAEGLEAAHQKAIIHRDIKPANIFITTRGDAKILDFGLAKLVGENSPAPAVRATKPTDAPTSESAALHLTRTGTTVGTAYYMSPEQVLGEKLDERTDLFSLGLVLYETVAGQRAFAGETGPAVHDAILHREPTPIRQLNPAVPAELERIINKALAKDRSLRYQSAGQLAADLRRLKRGPQSGAYRWLYAAAALLSILALAVALRWFKGRQIAPRPPLTEHELTHNLPENHLIDLAISPDGKYEAYEDMTGLFIGEIESGKVRSVPLPEDLRTHLWSVNWFPDGQRLILWTEQERNDSLWSVPVSGGAPVKLRDGGTWPAVSPDGSTIAFIAGQILNGLGHEVWLMGPNGESQKRIVGSDSNWYSSPTWSPTGRRVAYFALSSALRNGPTGIRTVSPEGDATEVYQSKTGAANNLVWARDRRIIFALHEATAKVSYNLWSIPADPDSGKPAGPAVKSTHWDGALVSPSSISADGTRLTILRERASTNVFVGELKDGGRTMSSPRRLTISESFDVGTDWTPDSKSVFFSSSRTDKSQIYRQEIGKDTPDMLIQSADDEEGAELTPDGKWILYWSASGASATSVTRLMRYPAAGGTPVKVLELSPNEDGDFHCPTLAGISCVLRRWQQGHLIFYALDPIQGQGKELGRTEMNAPANLDWSISPDGQRIALSSGDQLHGQIRLLDLRHATERNLPLDWRIGGLAWTIDGKALFVAGRTTSHILARVDLDGKAHVLLDSARSQLICCPRPSPDGRYLSFSEMNFMSNAWLLENF